VRLLAHGIGVVRDLPIPAIYFFVGATIVLGLSFVLLLALWKRPLLEEHSGGRALPSTLSRALLSRALRVLLGLFSVVLFVLTLATALFGTTTSLLNFAPTFVYVVFWLGIPLLSVLFGNVWSALSPWRAIADATVWLLELGGREARPVLEWSGRWGRYPAAAALFSFVALELTKVSPDYPRTLAIAIALYSYWRSQGWRCTGARRGRAAVRASRSCSSCSRASRRSRRVTAASSSAGRSPGSPVTTTRPGALLFVAVMLGSTSFDGFSRTSRWQDLTSQLRANLADSSQRTVDLALMVVNLVGLVLLIAAVLATYLAAVAAAEKLGGIRRSLVPDFVLPLVPIAAAYMTAHYFTLAAIQGQFIIPLISDPFGRGWDLFGTVDFAPNLSIVSYRTVWYVQVAALVIGHVAGLAIAHDRAVVVFPHRRSALEAQLPMLGLMVLYTVAGMWLLSQS
jgi:hypothetical protein